MTKPIFSSITMILFAFLAIFMSVRYAMLAGGQLFTNVIGVDWRLYFQPAAESLMRGRSPYDVSGFWNPPWMLLPIMIFAKMPLEIAAPMLFVLNTMACIWASLRLGMNKFVVFPFFIFFGSMMNSVMGNIDGLLALGLLCPPWLGIIILMIKPQVGFPIVLFWVANELAQKGTVRQKAARVLRLLLPFTILLIASTFLYGAWFLHSVDAIGKTWNTAPWPLGIPVGLWLVGAGIQKRDVSFVLMSTPFITPYLTIYTWSFSAMGAFIALSQLFAYEKIPIREIKAKPFIKVPLG